MRSTLRIVVALGTIGLFAAGGVDLWSLHANGVSGSALLPHYSKYFGFTTSVSLPSNPTLADLRHAGIRLPKDVVEHRRLPGRAYRISLILVGVAIGVRLRRRPNPMARKRSDSVAVSARL